LIPLEVSFTVLGSDDPMNQKLAPIDHKFVSLQIKIRKTVVWHYCLCQTFIIWHLFSLIKYYILIK